MVSNDAVEKPTEGPNQADYGSGLTLPRPEIVEYRPFGAVDFSSFLSLNLKTGIFYSHNVVANRRAKVGEAD